MNGTIHISVDINGSKGPNTWGKDLFDCEINSEREILAPNCAGLSEAVIDADCSTQAYQGGFCCATKLRKDNWEMKEDYPW